MEVSIDNMANEESLLSVITWLMRKVCYLSYLLKVLISFSLLKFLSGLAIR